MHRSADAAGFYRIRRALQCLVLALTVSTVAAFDFNRLQRQLIARFGEGQLPLLRDWQKLLAESRSVAEKDKLK